MCVAYPGASRLLRGCMRAGAVLEAALPPRRALVRHRPGLHAHDHGGLLYSFAKGWPRSVRRPCSRARFSLRPPRCPCGGTLVVRSG